MGPAVADRERSGGPDRRRGRPPREIRVLEALTARAPTDLQIEGALVEKLIVLVTVELGHGRVTKPATCSPRRPVLNHLQASSSYSSTVRRFTRDLRRRIVACLAAERKWDEATEAAEAIAGLGFDPNEDHYSSAVALAFCAAAIATDDRMAEGRRLVRSRAG